MAGFTFGQPSNTATGTGSLFGSLPIRAPTAAVTSNLFGTPATTAATGFSFGGTATPAASSSFSLGGLGGTATTTAATGFSFGGLGGATTGTTFGGLGGASTGTTFGGLGGTTTGTTFGGLGGATTGTTFGGLGGATTGTTFGGLGGATTGTTLGGFGTTTTAASTGFSFGKPATAGPSLFGSSLTTTTAASTGLTFGTALGSTAKTNSLTPGTSTLGGGGGIFGNTSTAASTGLGGVDPKASTSLSNSNNNGKTSDVKVVKATPLDTIIVQSVDAFKKYVKDEKSVREDITRMSSKDLIKVQEDIQSLKQSLAMLTSGVHRNVSAVEKLKWDTTQELKNAEMSHRTKDTPPGLQYEHTAPTLYFQKLAESFEYQMQTYRKQIEVMEGHLTSLRHSNMSPQELILLLKKLNETFIALAAQLHQVHESVKTQKEHYLNYRRVFHGDTKNVFERQTTTPTQPILPKRRVDHEGPSPFRGITSATAAAMASALTRSQQPIGAPPAVGLGQPSTMGTSGLFGTSNTSSLFGSQPNTSFGGSIFGNSNPNNSSLFGASQLNQTQPLFGAVENKPFQLQKPPQGAKRGKR